MYATIGEIHAYAIRLQEFNAVASKTPHLNHSDQHLRLHSEENRKQQAEFLECVDEDSTLHDEMIAWFKTLPLYLNLMGLRGVHVCWREQALETLDSRTDNRQQLKALVWPDVVRRGSETYGAAGIAAKTG